jgi:hypothetical protein
MTTLAKITSPPEDLTKIMRSFSAGDTQTEKSSHLIKRLLPVLLILALLIGGV